MGRAGSASCYNEGMATKYPWSGWENRIHADGSLTDEDKDIRIRLLPVLGMNDYIPLWPSMLQAGFMLRQEQEVILAGERRGGKTVGVLMENVRLTTLENFTGIFFRETENELKRKNGIIDTLSRWLLPFPEWTWNYERMEFRNSKFNSALICTFLKEPADQERHLGFEYWRLNYEELTRYPFTEDFNAYFWLMSSSNVPMGAVDWLGQPMHTRINSTSNPGGTGEEWVMAHFLSDESKRIPVGKRGSYMMVLPKRDDPNPDDDDPDVDHGHGGKCYIHVTIEDNPGIDARQYRRSLRAMKDKDPVTYAQMAEGRWGVSADGGMFDVDKILHLPYLPLQVEDRVRAWDKAGSEDNKNGRGARTASIRMSRIDPRDARSLWGEAAHNIHFVIEHGLAGYWSPDTREDVIDIVAAGSRNIAALWHDLLGRSVSSNAHLLPREAGLNREYAGDGIAVKVVHEQEGGSGGKNDAEITTRRLALMRFIVEHQKAGVNKVIRARQVAAAIGAGMVAIVADESWDWQGFLAELRSFPKGVRVDYVDALSLAYNNLALGKTGAAAKAGPRRETPPGFLLANTLDKRRGKPTNTLGRKGVRVRR